jgi:hypothetical protein
MRALNHSWTSHPPWIYIGLESHTKRSVSRVLDISIKKEEGEVIRSINTLKLLEFELSSYDPTQLHSIIVLYKNNLTTSNDNQTIP